MLKKQEEFNVKEEAKTSKEMCHELTDKQLEQISGGGYYFPMELRLDGSLCFEDCCGRCDKDDCGYTFCPRDRW